MLTFIYFSWTKEASVLVEGQFGPLTWRRRRQLYEQGKLLVKLLVSGGGGTWPFHHKFPPNPDPTLPAALPLFLAPMSGPKLWPQPHVWELYRPYV